MVHGLRVKALDSYLSANLLNHPLPDDDDDDCVDAGRGETLPS